MSWLNEHKRGWRITFLILLFTALIGPWFLERINIPGPYDCPGIRLDENMCGTPTSILWMLIFILFNLNEFIASLLNGTSTISALLLISAGIIILLPLVSTLFLILYEDHRRRKILQIVIFTLAAAASLFWASQLLQDFSSVYWAIWGTWLYISATASMLLLESLLLLENPQPAQE